MRPTTNTDLLAQLQQLTAGLYFVTEADAPLDAVSYPAPRGELPSPALLRTLGEPADAPVQVSPLAEFLRYHTDPTGVLDSPELAGRYQALQAFLQQHLAPVQVYRVGSEPKLHAYALGKLPDGQLAGFKTVLTQT
jgi:histidine triad (HIT) family protein